MASRTIIPRFLLPLQGPLWRGVRIPLSQNIHVRFASKKAAAAAAASASSPDPSKPIVLEKPARFNPPSHGSRIKRNAMPKHYGPQLTASELAEQNTRDYPGTMAPEGTWAHWFWHSRMLHTLITMGTLFSLGIFTFFMNYAYNSPYSDLVPPISDLWSQPLYFFAAWKNVIAMHEADKRDKAIAHRNANNDDVAKRRYFMKMHGIEPKDPIAMVIGSNKGKSEEELEAAAMGREAPPAAAAVEESKEEEPKKKRFGIF